MLDVIKRYIKSFVPVLRNSHLVTSAGVRMRNPINERGEWIGWTAEEVAEHLSSLNGGKHNIIVKEDKPKEPSKVNE